MHFISLRKFVLLSVFSGLADDIVNIGPLGIRNIQLIAITTTVATMETNIILFTALVFVRIIIYIKPYNKIEWMVLLHSHII
jgi:hypothetical protein